jgi:microcystin-dependent protein
MTRFREATPWFALPGMGSVPVGAVVPFAGNIGPSTPPGPPRPATEFGTTSPIEAWGWMACDGRKLTIAQYPELFVALGFLYSPGSDGKDGTFGIPDYRGYFLRGMGGSAAVDPEPEARKSNPPGGNDRGIGSVQGFALQSHEHNYLETQAFGAGNTGEAGAPGPTTKKTQGGPVTAEDASPVKVSPKETRPVNIYVNFIIKFTAGASFVPI